MKPRAARAVALRGARAVQVRTAYTDEQEKTGRPLSPHVSIYKFPVVALSSITVRVTGCGLAAGACARGRRRRRERGAHVSHFAPARRRRGHELGRPGRRRRAQRGGGRCPVRLRAGAHRQGRRRLPPRLPLLLRRPPLGTRRAGRRDHVRACVPHLRPPPLAPLPQVWDNKPEMLLTNEQVEMSSYILAGSSAVATLTAMVL